MQFESWVPEDGSVEVDALCAWKSKTVVVEGLEEWIQLAVWSNTVPRMSNLNSPLMSALWTVTIGGEFEVDLHEQMKKMMIRDQTKKNFTNWSRIERDWRLFVLCVLEGFLENLKNFDLTLGKCVFLLWLDDD